MILIVGFERKLTQIVGFERDVDRFVGFGVSSESFLVIAAEEVPITSPFISTIKLSF